ncbi:MAG: acylphosphatase [Candidatus Omnitrophica bacterium]|nr:acylphosphatase [Candidatus Omnitrophota bacterium]
MRKRIHVFYSGRVQGVGFRAMAEELACQLGVVGWIKNLRDGRVELLAESEEEKLEKFLEALRTSSMKNFIRQVEIAWGDATDTYDDFTIRYS